MSSKQLERFICARCVMDRTASEIVFDENGYCNFCTVALQKEQERLEEKPRLDSIYKSILENGRGKKYDVLLGLSGGVDSSLCLYYLVQNGIRPLCFSIDNGWNDPRADENIMRLVEGMKVPFIRYTIDIDRFRELQASFFWSGTKNIEIPTDHILMASSYEMASKYGIKYIISGGNHATESIMPESWGYQPRDLVHIKDIYRKSTGKELSGLPMCGLLKYNWYKWVKRIKTINLLDYYEYNRKDAIALLQEKFGYKDYGEKHGESYFTRWFQAFYLFEKFGIDKRKAHLSSLIVSGQMTREEALQELEQSPVYPKLGIEQKVMRYPTREYTDFKTDERLFRFISKIVRTCRSLGILPRA